MQEGADVGFIPSPSKLEARRLQQIQQPQQKTAKLYARFIIGSHLIALERSFIKQPYFIKF